VTHGDRPGGRDATSFPVAPRAEKEHHYTFEEKYVAMA